MPEKTVHLRLSLFAKFAGRFDDTVEGRLSVQPFEVREVLLERVLSRAEEEEVWRERLEDKVYKFEPFWTWDLSQGSAFQLLGRARINFLFRDVFAKQLAKFAKFAFEKFSSLLSLLRANPMDFQGLFESTTALQACLTCFPQKQLNYG